jgi:NADP-dependent 3-hydroxy acid dehydrogenase YdfG
MLPPAPHHGLTALVTGASSGIGEATALRLASRGWRVAMGARRAERLVDLERRIKDAGGRCVFAQCDVTKKKDVFALVDRAERELGPVHALVNNAGVMPLSRMEACRVDDWMDMIDVNLKGVLYAVAGVLPKMLAREPGTLGRGHILNVSSVAGRRVFPGGAVYCATKFGVHALSEGLRSELAGKGVRVTVVAPGLVATELQHHIADPEHRERILRVMREQPPLSPADVALAIAQALEAPANVGVNEVVLRPAWQEA